MTNSASGFRPLISGLRFLTSGLWPLTSGFCLLAFIAFNHPQGLGMAGLGLSAVAVWRLIEWRRSMIWWLATAALALSVAAVLWWPRNPALDSVYRPGGWLTAWYGFNVFSFQTDAGDRTRQIIGFFGLINLVAACVLLRRNHVVGWLTITPLLALCLPFVAIPFAGVLAKDATDWGQIITFHRMLLAIPAGLALVALGAEIANRKGQESSEGISQEETKVTERATNEPAVCGRTASFSSLPSVRSSQEIAKEAEGDRSAVGPDLASVPPRACRTGEQAPARAISQEETKVTERVTNETAVPGGIAPFSSLPSVKTDTPTAHGDIACPSTDSASSPQAGSGPRACRTGKQTPTTLFSSLPSVRFSQEETKAAKAEGTTASIHPGGAPLAPLPPVKRLGLLFSRFAALPLCFLSLAALLVVPANRPFYNRFWQALMVPPDDLAMRAVIEATDAMAGDGGTKGSKFGDKALLATPGIGFVLESAGRACLLDTTRVVRQPPASITDALVEKLRRADPSVLRIQPFWPVDVLSAPYSQSGFLSGHWLPCDVALELSTQEELFRAPMRPAAERRPPQLWLLWTSGLDKTRYYGTGSDTPLRAAVEDRGSMNSQKGFATPLAGDQLVLTPILRTLDSNGRRVSINVTGPDSFHRSFDVTRRPTPLAGDGDPCILANLKVRFPKPGQYTIELVGEVVWPVQAFTVRYTLTVADAVSSAAGN